MNGTHGNHFSPSNCNTIFLASIASPTIRGMMTKELVLIARRISRFIWTLSSWDAANDGNMTDCIELLMLLTMKFGKWLPLLKYAKSDGEKIFPTIKPVKLEYPVSKRDEHSNFHPNENRPFKRVSENSSCGLHGTVNHIIATARNTFDNC